MQQYWENEDRQHLRLKYHPLRHLDCAKLKRVTFFSNTFIFIPPFVHTVAVNVADSHEPNTILTNHRPVFMSRDQYRPITDQYSCHVICLSLSETINQKLSQDLKTRLCTFSLLIDAHSKVKVSFMLIIQINHHNKIVNDSCSNVWIWSSLSLLK